MVITSDWCIRYFKDTNFEANYNKPHKFSNEKLGVFDISKILISKQITTAVNGLNLAAGVYSIFQRY